MLEEEGGEEVYLCTWEEEFRGFGGLGFGVLGGLGFGGLGGLGGLRFRGFGVWGGLGFGGVWGLGFGV